ncbi:MAG: GNAT family N-acetyltransferase [Flavobacteriales bacterium]|nr:GNAT family N-acetyltransferase [Flavobacteriales bacterium]
MEHFLLAPDFETSRLRIAYHDDVNWKDWTAFFIPENLAYLGLEPDLGPEELSKSWSLRQRGRYEEGHGAVLFLDKVSGDVVGNAGLIKKCINGIDLIEVGYSLLSSKQGNGYATEMAQAIRDEAFLKTDVDELCSTIHPHNLSSQRVAERNGMRIFKRTQDKGMDLDIWKITRKEWERIRPNSQK